MNFARIWVLALPLMVGACTDGPTLTAPKSLSFRSAPDTVSVARGDIIVGGPSNYCIDKKGSRVSGDPAFVLLASCASISGDTSLPYPANPALLTASVEKRTSESPDASDLFDLVNSPQGRAVLARDGQASSVSIITALRNGDSVLVQINDQSADVIPGLDKTYWRSLFTLNGRLITIAVVGFEGRSLPSEAGLATLKSFENRIRTETPKLDVTAATGTKKAGRGGLFRNLLR